MMKHILSLALLVVLQVSLISCRSDYYNYYTDDHDKKVSTPEIELSPGDENNTGVPENITVIQKGSYFTDNYDFYNHYTYYNTVLAIQIGVGVGVVCCILIFIGVICGIIFCCPGCCRKVRPGFVMGNNTIQTTIPRPQQIIGVHHVPPKEPTSQLPPAYTEQKVQLQQQTQKPAQQDSTF